MRWRWLCAVGLVAPVPIAVQACASFSSGQCTDLAVCPASDGEGGSLVDTAGGVDSPFDSLVRPDGPLADGACNGGAEDCSNGLDDNCNGLIDCADPVCQAGFTCAEPPPSGWQGPLSLWEAMGSAPACGSAYGAAGVDAHAGLSAPGAQCTCNCPTPATGQVCNLGANVSVYSGFGCSTACQSFTLPISSFCYGGMSCGQNASYTSVIAPPNGGSCAPTVSVNVPMVTWATNARTCSYSAPKDNGGCGASLCVAKPSTPFGGPCISQSGDLPCPMVYPTKHLYYGGVGDSRGCSVCTCGSPVGGTCTATSGVDFYGDASCTSAVLATGSFGVGCVNISQSSYPNFHGAQTLGSFSLGGAGTCSPMGGVAQGSATAASPTTVCCK